MQNLLVDNDNVLFDLFIKLYQQVERVFLFCFIFYRAQRQYSCVEIGEKKDVFWIFKDYFL